jgi:hypothetical protein
MDQPQTKTLCEELKAAGVEMLNHESDLYVPDTPEVRAILAKHRPEPSTTRGFTNQAPPHVGERWLDVPFAYDPWWEAKNR